MPPPGDHTAPYPSPLHGHGEERAWVQPAFYVILFIACLLTYHGITDNYLFNDDFSWLRAGRYGMEPGNLLTYRVVNFFRPLVNASFYAMERIAPGNIRLNSAFNLCLHFLNTVLVFHLLLRLLESRRAAMAAGMIFAVSSLHTGAVFWISARTTLLSTFFLLASLVLLVSGEGHRRRRTASAVALYILALASKETAIAGLLLVALIHAFGKRRENLPGPGRGAVAAFLAVSILYLVIRKTVMGGFIQANWGPGAHAVRNTAGAFIYQFYPWPVFSLFYKAGTGIPEPTHPFVPEILALPLILAILWIGARTKRTGVFLLLSGWTVAALLPSSAFTYRFFSTASITQNRYYYLSTVGSVAVIASLLALLYNGGSRFRRAAAASIFVLLCAGYMVRVHRIEKKWDEFTGMYREIVATAIEETSNFPGESTLAIENPPLAFPYIADALILERPELEVVEAAGGRDEAMRSRPCLYISYIGDKTKRIRIERLK